MITLEDTEATVKRCEQHLHRAASDDASPKAKVLATEISGQDTAAELAALKATTKAQDAKIKALSAQLRGDTSGAKRACNGVPVEKNDLEFLLTLRVIALVLYAFTCTIGKCNSTRLTFEMGKERRKGRRVPATFSGFVHAQIGIVGRVPVSRSA
jgi:hypothetical protein